MTTAIREVGRNLSREHIADSYHLTERAYGRFARSIPLPPNVDAAQAKTTCVNGVLTIELPRTAAGRSGRLTVK